MAHGKRLILVVAMDRNRAIGRNGEMPWHLPADLAHFKRTTMGTTVVMGRKTLEAIGRPLPGRQNIVLTRRGQATVGGVETAADLNAALALARSATVHVIGGGEIYRQTINHAHELIITRVDTAVANADTYFPAIDPDLFQCVERAELPADERNAHAMTFERWLRSDRL